MTAIILAAGFSRRFGGKKLLAKINQKPMILHVVDLVLSMGFEDVLLIYHDDDVRNSLDNRNIRCIKNESAADGLSTSIICGIQETDPSDGYIFFSGDQPFIDRQTVSRLLDAFTRGMGTIIVPVYDGRRGNPVIFAVEWKDELKEIRGDVGGREIIKANPKQVYLVDVSDSKVGIDIDTWEQYIQHFGGNEN